MLTQPGCDLAADNYKFTSQTPRCTRTTATTFIQTILVHRPVALRPHSLRIRGVVMIGPVTLARAQRDHEEGDLVSTGEPKSDHCPCSIAVIMLRSVRRSW